MAQYGTLNNVDLKRIPKDPGYVPPRRLNRAEYKYTVEDLFGIEFDASTLPKDQSSQDTFDNEAVVLTVQPLLIEKYIGNSEKVVISKSGK